MKVSSWTASSPSPTSPPRSARSSTATPELKKQWRELFETEPPSFNRRYLESRLAYRIQELAYGGLKPETVKRLEALGEQLDGGDITVRRIRTDLKPIAGTRLVREWQGVEHVVTVLADGFEWRGRPYQSLRGRALETLGVSDLGRFLADLGYPTPRRGLDRLVETQVTPVLRAVAAGLDVLQGPSFKRLGDMIASQIEAIRDVWRLDVDVPERDAFVIRGGGFLLPS